MSWPQAPLPAVCLRKGDIFEPFEGEGAVELAKNPERVGNGPRYAMTTTAGWCGALAANHHVNVVQLTPR